MRADHAAAGADVRQRLQLLAHVLAATGDRRERLGLRQVEEDRARSARRRRRSAATAPPCDGSSGANAGLPLSEPSAVCSSPVTCAERAQARRAARRDRDASSSSASSQPSRAPARYSCRIPSVASIRRPSYLVPAGQRRRCAGTRARTGSAAARAPGSRPARRAGTPSGSASSPNTIDEFDCSTPTGRTSTVPPSPAPRRRRPAEEQLPSSTGLQLAVGAHPVQQLAPVRGIGERVVDRPAVGLADHALAPALVGRPQPERHLVGLVRARRRSAPRRGTARAAAPPSRSGTRSTTSMCETSRVLEANQRWATIHSLAALSLSRGRREVDRCGRRSSSSVTSWNQ